MLVSEIITRVQNGFGDSNQVMIFDEHVIDWINEGMLEIVRETQCLSKTESSIIADAFRAGGVSIADMILLKRVYHDGESLTLLDIEAMDRSLLKPNTEGTPFGYYTEGNKIFVYPIPVISNHSAMSIVYVPSPVTVTTPSETPGIPAYYHGDLAEWCLAKAHERNENFRASELIMTRFMKNLSKRKYESLSKDDSYRTISPDIMDYDYGYDLI